MNRLPFHTLIFGLGAAAAFAAAQAQNGENGLDLDAIRARAAEQAKDAEALAATVRARSATALPQARASAEQGGANGKRFAAEAKALPSRDGNLAFDFDRLIAQTGQMAEASLGTAPRFVGFASSSMPPAALRQMMHDVTKAGGVVVLRGLPQGSAKALTASLSRVLAPGERLDGVGIDPRLFRAFGIEAVPTYVMATSDFELCDGFDCTTAVPPHDRISGNVSADYALETFASGGGPGARLAALHLARLRKDAR